MEVFEGKTWISGQGLVDACIGISDGKITAVKKILREINIQFFKVLSYLQHLICMYISETLVIPKKKFGLPAQQPQRVAV